MPPSPEQVSSFLRRLRHSVSEGRLEIRAYALDGMRDLEWTTDDLRLQLLELARTDFLRVEDSTAPQGGIIWVFTPEYWDGGHLWIRLVERAGVVVVSFHRG
ncbi:hypothetical protein L6R53_00815 [Myxococcota bacterium]|nr:hypothetical protein [Myxococcota bacterium]